MAHCGINWDLLINCRKGVRKGNAKKIERYRERESEKKTVWIHSYYAQCFDDDRKIDFLCTQTYKSDENEFDTKKYESSKYNS